MSFELESLPYAENALEPMISAETVGFHYKKHHLGYVTKLNALVNGTDLAKKSLIDIIKSETGKAFNLAAQIWNHSFYWKGMKAGGGGKPSPALADRIKNQFGSFETFQTQFTNEALNHFGSGWTWLVRDDANNLSIVSTHDAGNPMSSGKIPMLTIDVWEHAYYIDYRNDRGAYIKAWWGLVNWEFVESNLA